MHGTPGNIEVLHLLSSTDKQEYSDILFRKGEGGEGGGDWVEKEPSLKGGNAVEESYITLQEKGSRETSIGDSLIHFLPH